MSITQFAMVEELASLIKDNFSSRHLVLAIEEALISYLQDDASPVGILELEPMSSYHRLILHRLADIFGFAHESVGEGDDHHLVLQRCLETSIPSVLVSDILWQYDACEPLPVPYQLLRRDETSTVLKMNLTSSANFLEREAAYMAARERIFGMEQVGLEEASRQKPRHNPAVARRMIVHALGQRINQCTQVKSCDSGHSDGLSNLCDVEKKLEVNMSLHSETSSGSHDIQENNARGDRVEPTDGNGNSSVHDEGRELSHAARRTGRKDGLGPLGNSRERMREENVGAARRMFAHALGIPASKDAASRAGR